MTLIIAEVKETKVSITSDHRLMMGINKIDIKESKTFKVKIGDENCIVGWSGTRVVFQNMDADYNSMLDFSVIFRAEVKFYKEILGDKIHNCSMIVATEKGKLFKIFEWGEMLEVDNYYACIGSGSKKAEAIIEYTEEIDRQKIYQVVHNQIEGVSREYSEIILGRTDV